MNPIRRVRRLVGDLVKTLAGILVYLGVTGAIALASLHVIATEADLKCEVCADPGRALALALDPRRDDSPGATSGLALRGSLATE
jgi:hypothetical protein